MSETTNAALHNLFWFAVVCVAYWAGMRSPWRKR